MSIKKLNLDEIQDEILDECFENDDKTLDSLVIDEDDFDNESTEEVIDNGLTMDKIKSKVKSDQYVSNEDLVRKVQNNIDVERSKELLIMFNSGLVYNEAKNCTCNIPFQDKVQYGFEGLIKAIHGFNTNFKTLFSTYATTAIRQHMYRNGNNDVRMVALPEHLSMFNIRIQGFIERSMNDAGGYPTHEQIAAGTGIDIRSVKRIMNYNSNTFSIDTPMVRGGDEGSQQTLKDMIAGDSADYFVDERCVSKDFLSTMDEILNELLEHERVLIGLVHGLDGYRTHTFDEIISTGYIDSNGSYVTSKATLSRRYNNIMDKVRRIVERKEISFD
ncbi:Group 2 RNA polymerase sigma factor @ RNA polymerase sigma factor RpoD [Yersinia phage fHe-Yen9-04]|uniref:Group 2 RNA polymerase sigma factor @ RNA polymerase sigma factor RpoD n=2 Tax=Eneladusvirus Yen904 TaxID=2560849 RepID=A0A2C9CY62_9CAUD|nr:RNA polymerase sigma factor [Yersinia phage fHe-Yen9-04]SOK58775.1 Group 2 RNA polymerase sigma factor @ RNA polymerase sigma factor RpoD [Yersinia phage fHe-Yen9-04]SOK59311.1 Group 2 RNA polymerase sigma factor @ RNA polymerase sigma factor RpoD [Yersinia phage fHe-Yen9-03]VUE36544.1 Group 2 RNA polymerase sigma factor @ RNA polymerase sigma factor RpoD [Yersinia phage fHe-Yen9-04]